jgi:hypothetical protein
MMLFLLVDPATAQTDTSARNEVPTEDANREELEPSASYEPET